MGYVYKFTIRDNNKWYIGSHNGSNKNYKGSGLLWRKALKKYGEDSFDVEILYEGEDFRAEEERILKMLDAAGDPQSYNLKNEAWGGSFPGELNGMYGKKLTPEQRYERGNGFRGKKRPEHSEKMKGKNNPMYGKNEHSHGIVNYAKGRAGISNEDFFGKEKSDSIAKKISKKNKGKKKPPGFGANMTGGRNHAAKPVVIDGIYYGCIKEAMDKLNLSRQKVKKLNELNA